MLNNKNNNNNDDDDNDSNNNNNNNNNNTNDYNKTDDDNNSNNNNNLLESPVESNSDYHQNVSIRLLTRYLFFIDYIIERYFGKNFNIIWISMARNHKR